MFFNQDAFLFISLSRHTYSPQIFLTSHNETRCYLVGLLLGFGSLERGGDLMDLQQLDDDLPIAAGALTLTATSIGGLLQAFLTDIYGGPLVIAGAHTTGA